MNTESACIDLLMEQLHMNSLYTAFRFILLSFPQ